jgi:hypothetical protein
LPVKFNKVREEILLYQVRVKFGNTIDLFAANNCEVGHADLLGEALCEIAPTSPMLAEEVKGERPSMSDKRASRSRSPGNFFSTASKE